MSEIRRKKANFNSLGELSKDGGAGSIADMGQLEDLKKELGRTGPVVIPDPAGRAERIGVVDMDAFPGNRIFGTPESGEAPSLPPVPGEEKE